MNSKVSIIVPVYNVGNYIERGITSLCKQDYTNIEIIIVDNGSTDNSINIIRRLASKDTRIVYISEKSQGVPLQGMLDLKRPLEIILCLLMGMTGWNQIMYLIF